MEIKLLEVRDRATFIPAFAFTTYPNNESQKYLLRRSGYSALKEDPIIMVGRLIAGKCEYDFYNWGKEGTRTMLVAHQYIQNNWDDLQDGDVVDVEFILKETDKKKISEKEEYPL